MCVRVCALCFPCLCSRARPVARYSELYVVHVVVVVVVFVRVIIVVLRICRRRRRRVSVVAAPLVPSSARRDLDVVVVVVVVVAGPPVPSTDATSFASPLGRCRRRRRLSSAPSSSFLGCRCSGRRGASVLRPPVVRCCFCRCHLQPHCVISSSAFRCSLGAAAAKRSRRT